MKVKKERDGVIYADEIDASKIPVEWYSWMHFTSNKIEKNHKLEKYKWQKPHKPNLTGTDSAYYPNKNKNVNVAISGKSDQFFNLIAERLSRFSK